MMKHLARIGFAPLRVLLLILALPIFALGLLVDTLIESPRSLARSAFYRFSARAYWAAMYGAFVP